MTPQQALLDAVAYIEKHGWVQLNPLRGSPLGGCAINAITYVTHDWDSRDGAQDLLKKELGLEGPSLHDVYAWNDAPGQTKENVLATMRRAAGVPSA